MPAYAFSYEALADLLQRRRRAKSVLLACIDGPGASGKSTISEGLVTASEDIQIVHMDDFYRPSADRFAGPIAERPIGADFDLGRLRSEVLMPLRAGQLADYHVYDWTTDRVSARTVPLTKPIVVIEGVYSFSLELSRGA